MKASKNYVAIMCLEQKAIKLFYRENFGLFQEFVVDNLVDGVGFEILEYGPQTFIFYGG